MHTRKYANRLEMHSDEQDINLTVYDSDIDPKKNKSSYLIRMGISILWIENLEQLNVLREMLDSVAIENPIHAARHESKDVDAEYTDGYDEEFIEDADGWMTNPYNGFKRDPEGRIYDSEDQLYFDPKDESPDSYGREEYDFYNDK